MATIGQQVAEQVTRITTEVTEQTDLIAQMNTALDDLGAVVGGGSGGLETCQATMEFLFDGPGGMGDISLFFTNSSGEFETAQASIGDLLTLNVAKNTILYIWGLAVGYVLETTLSGNAEELPSMALYATNRYHTAFAIRGDVSIVVTYST